MRRPPAALRRLEVLAGAAPAAVACLEEADSVLDPLLRDLDSSGLVSEALWAPLLAVADGAAVLTDRLSRMRRVPPARRRAARLNAAPSVTQRTIEDRARLAVSADPERVAAVLHRYGQELVRVAARDRRGLSERAELERAERGGDQKRRSADFSPATRFVKGPLSFPGQAVRTGQGSVAAVAAGRTESELGRNPLSKSVGREVHELAPPRGQSARASEAQVGGGPKGSKARTSLQEAARARNLAAGRRWLAARVARAGVGADLPVVLGAPTEGAQELWVRPAEATARSSSMPQVRAEAEPPSLAPTVAADSGATGATASSERLARVLNRLRVGSRAMSNRVRHRPNRAGGPPVRETAEATPPASTAQFAVPFFPARGGLRALAALGPPVSPRGAPEGEVDARAETGRGAAGPGHGPAAPGLPDDDLESRFDRLLRREARRHGIEVDES